MSARPTPTQHDAWTATDQLVGRLEQQFAPPYAELDGCYGYDALPLVPFIRGLEVCGPPNGRMFLDVGCGIGTKMYLAHMLGWNVDGVEVHAPYADVARHVVPEGVVHLSDAFDFDGYGDADVIYTYALCHDLDRQAVLHSVIAERAKPGAFVFTPDRVFGHGASLGADVWRL